MSKGKPDRQLPSRIRLEQELAAFAGRLADGSVILDAGSGDLRYKPFFHRQNYESADFCQVEKKYETPTYECDLKAIPVEDGRYDAVVMTQVLEHLPQPSKVLAELYRVLKPGGRILVTAPLWYPEHEKPFDFFRFTQYGMRQLFLDSGFVVEDIHWLEGWMATISHQLEIMAKELPKSPAELKREIGWPAAFVFFLARPLFKWLSKLAAAAELRSKVQSRGYCINYVCLALKPQ
jgi:SAM-dependent methyltransferase